MFKWENSMQIQNASKFKENKILHRLLATTITSVAKELPFKLQAVGIWEATHGGPPIFFL